MKNQIFNFLKTYSTEPEDVDRLIVSAYFTINNLAVLNNRFLKRYLINKKDKVEFECLQQFVDVINAEISTFGIEQLIELFEFVISPSDRIINGAVYTPFFIRDYLVTKTFASKKDELHNVWIADIACGCAGFLCTAAKQLSEKTGKSYANIYKDQLFGLDIQKYSIIRSKLLLSILAITEGEDEFEFAFNLFQGDSLTFQWDIHYDNYQGFDIVLGNPPYVCARNLDDNVKQNVMRWEVSKSGNPDLYIPFFQIGFENLCEKGILGFITMNTFFKSVNGRALRNYFKEHKIALQIIDFGTQQIFKSKSTYTCICFLSKTEQHFVQYYKSEDRSLPKYRTNYVDIDYSVLDTKKGWNLNDHDVISQIESAGTALGELYQTRHGIATLRNDVYIFKPVAEDDNYYYLQNGRTFPIEKRICRDILNSNKLSREVDLETTKEKVIFPYDNNTKPNLLAEHTFRQQFPMAYQYLCDKKQLLDDRDKGKGKYENWFAFGRTQSLEKIHNKLFFPKYSDQSPFFIMNSDENLLFYNGQAVIGHSENEMLFIKKIMESRLFWYYIETTSKPYSSDYFSLNGNYIKNFGIYPFNEEELNYILQEENKALLDAFIERRYDVDLSFHE